MKSKKIEIENKKKMQNDIKKHQLKNLEIENLAKLREEQINLDLDLKEDEIQKEKEEELMKIKFEQEEKLSSQNLENQKNEMLLQFMAMEMLKAKNLNSYN